MMQSLIACLESNDDVQAVIISDTKHNGSIADAATGINRCFQIMETEEQSLESLKPVLMSHFRRLSSVHNIHYTEPVADEIIRLLGRYPGRAFTSSKRPEKAIAFADKVGAMVRINVFAEPVELAELRDQMGALRDRLDLMRQGSASSNDLVDTIEGQLVALRSDYREVNQKYENRFGPYLKAKNALDDIESRLGPIEAKQQQDRTAEERRDFNTLKDGLRPARMGVAREELKLHQILPEVTNSDVRKIFSDDSGVPLSNLSANKLDRLSGWKSTSAWRFSGSRRRSRRWRRSGENENWASAIHHVRPAFCCLPAVLVWEKPS